MDLMIRRVPRSYRVNLPGLMSRMVWIMSFSAFQCHWKWKKNQNHSRSVAPNTRTRNPLFFCPPIHQRSLFKKLHKFSWPIVLRPWLFNQLPYCREIHSIISRKKSFRQYDCMRCTQFCSQYLIFFGHFEKSNQSAFTGLNSNLQFIFLSTNLIHLQSRTEIQKVKEYCRK